MKDRKKKPKWKSEKIDALFFSKKKKEVKIGKKFFFEMLQNGDLEKSLVTSVIKKKNPKHNNGDNHQQR